MCRAMFLAVIVAGPVVAQPPAVRTHAEVAAQLLSDAQKSFARVRDYSGTFVKQERVRGAMVPEQTIELKVRQQPFALHMKWLGPKEIVGREACFHSGKHGANFRAKSSGRILGAFGFVTLSQRDSRAMQDTRHTIGECGIGALIDQLARGHEVESRLPPDQVRVRVGEYLFVKKPCYRVEVTRAGNTGQFYAYRTVAYYDAATRLPVRFEAYDWPHAGSPAGGDLLECYSYIDLKFNVNLPDSDFER